MKKSAFFCCLILIAMMSFGSIKALADESVRTEVFVPTSYLEYLSLTDPLDVSITEDVYAIAESKRIVVFKDGNFKYFTLADHSISKISLYSKDYVLFLSNSSLYALNVNTSAVSVVKDENSNDVKISNSFTVFDGIVTANTSSSISWYQGVVDENGFSLVYLTARGTQSNEYSKLAAIDKNNVFAVNGNTVSICSSSGISSVKQILPSVRHATTDGKDYYYTSDQGLIKISYSNGNAQSSPQRLLSLTASSNDLSHLVNPQGIYCYGGKLYICDIELDAVLCYDLTKSEFTDFAITSNPSADNRISPVACDLQVDGEKLYVLDDTKIKAFWDNGFSPAVKTDLPIAKAFCKQGNKLLITGGQNLYAMTINGNSATIDSLTSDYSNIIAMTSCGDEMFFLNGTSESTDSYAEIYSINAKDLNDLSKAKLISKKLGVGYDVTADLFGNVYAVILNNYSFSVYKFPFNGGEIVELYRTTDNISAITVDFECNVYALKENNKIVRITADKLTSEHSLTLSDNLPDFSAKDLIIIPATDKAYALFDGFILSVNSTDLKITAPDEIKVPDDYSVEFNPSVKVGKINDGAKIFKVRLEDSLGEIFNYIGYETYSLSEEFMIIFSNEQYTLAVNERLSCIVRTADISIEELSITPKEEAKHAVIDTFLYNYPLVTDYFKGVDFAYNDQCSVMGEFTFNGRAFALVKLGESFGYTPITMLKNAPASDGSPYSFKTMNVGNKEVGVYLDSGLTVLDSTLAPYTQIEVYGEENGVYKIAYKGGFYYVSTQGIQTKNYFIIRNVILVSIILLAVIVTFIYIYRRAFITKDNK